MPDDYSVSLDQFKGMNQIGDTGLRGEFRTVNSDVALGGEPVRSKYGLCTTVAYKIGQNAAQYALEGSIAITGALVQWMRDNLGLSEKLRH